MNRKAIITLIIFLLISAGVVGGIVVIKRKSTDANVQVPQLTQPALLTPPTSEETLWDDPAGFTFTYAKPLAVNKHDEDQVNYAHVEITDATHPGSIIVWAKDTTYADVAAWSRMDKSFKDASSIDTTLGLQPAKKLNLAGIEKKVVTGTIYDGLLFYIEGNLQEPEFWNSHYLKVVESFLFKPIPTDVKIGSVSDSSEVTADEEEVLE